MNVYVVAGGRRHVKIGIAKDVEKRRRGIQTGCPFTVRVIKSWNTSRAREIENKAHKVLARYRWAGEWFDVPTQVATLTVGMLVSALPCRSGTDRPLNRAVVFCRSCGHSAALKTIPAQSAKLRCTSCNKRDQVHVIDVVTPHTSDRQLEPPSSTPA